MIFNHIRNIVKDVKTPIVFEIGAHLLEDTLQIISLLGSDYKYYAFEPDPRNIAKINKENLKPDKVELIPMAIGAHLGYSDLYLSSGNVNGGEDWTGSSSIRCPKNHLNAHPWCKFESKVRVPTTTLDGVFLSNNINYITFIWADIQGAEADMIKGGQKALSRTNYLYCEYSDVELYEGQLPLNEWMRSLPGHWTIIEKYTHDVLLRNEDF